MAEGGAGVQDAQGCGHALLEVIAVVLQEGGLFGIGVGEHGLDISERLGQGKPRHLGSVGGDAEGNGLVMFRAFGAWQKIWPFDMNN
jgi:hypothetical protein